MITWKYALMEVFLITVGISLAFVLNNWNESRVERKMERFHLASIQTDVQATIDNLRRQYHLDTNQLVGARQLFKLLVQGRSVDEDSLRAYLNVFNTNPKFAPKDFNYQSLLQSGDYRIVRNEVLRKKMDEFFLDRLPSVSVTEGYYLKRLSDYYFPVKERIYIAHTSSWSNYEGLFDPFFIDNVFALPAYINQEMRQITRAITSGEELLVMLEQELN